MKRSILFFIFTVTFALYSCSTDRAVSNRASIPDLENELFATAERYFHAGLYTKALTEYQKYIEQYPKGSSADVALKKMATIHIKQGNSQAALETDRCLINQFPNSPYTSDARFRIMLDLVEQGRHKEVIFQASKIIEVNRDNDVICRTYTILGDTFLSMKLPMDAIFFYMIAYQKSALSEKSRIKAKLDEITDQLSKEKVLTIYEQLKDEFFKSYLLFQLACREYQHENYKEAYKLFSYFIENFPQDKNAEQAKNLIEVIRQRTAFNRQIIGCLLPLSGPYEAFGKRALKAIRLAVNQFNANSNKLALKLIVRDTRSDPEIVRHLVEELDERKVALIIGPMVTSEAAAKEAQKRRLPIITLTQRPGIPDLGDYVFRNFLTPEMQVESLISCAIDQFGITRFAILYPDDDYGRTFMNLFRDQAIYYGADIAEIASYQPDQTDFSDSIKHLADITEDDEKEITEPHRFSKTSHIEHQNKVKPDFEALFIPDGPEKAGLIAPQLAYWDVDDILLLGTNLWHSKRLIELGGNYVQYAVLPEVFFPQSSKKIVRDFVQFYEEAYAEWPGFIEALAYDTAMIAFQAAIYPQVQSRKDLRDELRNIRNFKGVTGLTSILQNGEAYKNLFLLQIDDQNFVEINRDVDTYTSLSILKE
jgi:ABC-type branched-subunit amino acid transport system substrate-binding protein